MKRKRKEPDEIHTLLRMLHDRGCEVTPGELKEWLWKIADGLSSPGQKLTAKSLADMIIDGDEKYVRLMYLKFHCP